MDSKLEEIKDKIEIIKDAVDILWIHKDYFQDNDNTKAKAVIDKKVLDLIKRV